MTHASKVPVKKPYHAPKLIVYGDLTQLTTANPMGKGRPDGVKKRRT
jgi:hypothetical protein